MHLGSARTPPFIAAEQRPVARLSSPGVTKQTCRVSVFSTLDYTCLLYHALYSFYSKPSI
jgi:hypothetical protein